MSKAWEWSEPQRLSPGRWMVMGSIPAIVRASASFTFEVTTGTWAVTVRCPAGAPVPDLEVPLMLIQAAAKNA